MIYYNIYVQIYKNERGRAKRLRPLYPGTDMKRMLRKFRFYFAMCSAKACAAGLKLLGRRASYLPGLVAVTLCKDFIGYLQKPETLICVTGTNGKTTTSNLLNTVFSHIGQTVTNNSYGSNVQAGVANALLLNSTFSGKHKNKVAVLEVDERSSPHIFPFMAPDYLLCNNIMRDSMKRNAHTEFISFIISSALPAGTKVILNADDLICAGLAPRCEDRTYFGVAAERPAGDPPAHVRDMVYCPKCGAPLKPEYIRFRHIGRYTCTACDLKSPEPDFCVTDINRGTHTFTVTAEDGDHTLRLINDNITNIYNLCGAVAVLRRCGVSWDEIRGALAEGELVQTRYEEVTAGKLHITRILAKGQNPVAVSGVLSYTVTCPGDKKCLLLIIDDKEDNIHNSESTCWLYDVDYSPLRDPSVDCIIFAGPRCKDQVLRAAMSGIDLSKVLTTDTVKNSAMLVDTEKYQDIYLLFENYWLDDALAEEKLLIERGEQGK